MMIQNWEALVSGGTILVALAAGWSNLRALGIENRREIERLRDTINGDTFVRTKEFVAYKEGLDAD
jgi:hypothetical protein